MFNKLQKISKTKRKQTKWFSISYHRIQQRLCIMAFSASFLVYHKRDSIHSISKGLHFTSYYLASKRADHCSLRKQFPGLAWSRLGNCITIIIHQQQKQLRHVDDVRDSEDKWVRDFAMCPTITRRPRWICHLCHRKSPQCPRNKSTSAIFTSSSWLALSSLSSPSLVLSVSLLKHCVQITT